MKIANALVALVSILLASAGAASTEIAEYGEPLKAEYPDPRVSLHRTNETGFGYSMTCDMGAAIEDKVKEGWYTNRPIEGLTLQLKARIKLKSEWRNRTLGFVTIVKHGDVLRVFKPIGHYEDGGWVGDTFSSWGNEDTSIKLYNQRSGTEGYAHFDLIDGDGFYYESQDDRTPKYFLSNCRRIKKKFLPVYEYITNTQLLKKLARELEAVPFSV